MMDRVALHVGCGGESLSEMLTGYKEVRLDIDPKHDPDIVASMTDVGDIGTFDAVYCCHSLEHVYPWEVSLALKEFARVTKPGGFVIIIVPDLEDVRPTAEVILDSPAGPLCGLDLIYGLQRVAGMPHMAHHSGFTAETLGSAMLASGLSHVSTKRMNYYNLLAVGIK
jgi:SAM-dependent methyltransferase